MANVMELMREYKNLKAMQQAGKLSQGDEDRLREVAAYLQGAMASRKEGGTAAAAKPAPTAATTSAAPAAPKPTVPAAPKPAVPAAPKPAVAAAPKPAPAAPSKPLWQKQQEEDAERQKRAQALFQVAVPDEVMEYEPTVSPDSGPLEHVVLENETGVSFAPEIDIDNDPRFKQPPKHKPRPRTIDELQQQLEQVHSQSLYSTSFDELQAEYYYEYFDEGYGLVDNEAEVEAETIDPREIELRRAGLISDTGTPGEGAASITAVPGGVFLDDFMVLYEKGVLPRPEDDEEPELEDPNALVPGKRKVALHMLSGEVKRGSVAKILRGAPVFVFQPERGKGEEIDFGSIKALFIMRSKNPPTPGAAARRLTVEFKDRRRIQGVSWDFQPGQPMFTLVPQGPGNFELVIINVAAAARIG